MNETIGCWNIDELNDKQLRQIVLALAEYLKVTINLYNNENTNDQDEFVVKKKP